MYLKVNYLSVTINKSLVYTNYNNTHSTQIKKQFTKRMSTSSSPLFS